MAFNLHSTAASRLRAGASKNWSKMRNPAPGSMRPKPSLAAARMSAERERTLALALKKGCSASRDELITANLQLVVAIACRHANRGIALDDLIAEGNIGLINAVDSFDPDAGARFSTYATYWIAHSIVAAFVREMSGARMTRNERADRRAVDHARAEFRLLHGRSPTNEELAADLGWSQERVGVGLELIERGRRPHSLSESPRGDAEIAAAAPERARDSDDGVRAQVESLLDGLSLQDRAVVEQRFGLAGHEPVSIRDIARAINMPPRMVKVRLEAAMRKLGRLAERASTPTPSPILHGSDAA